MVVELITWKKDAGLILLSRPVPEKRKILLTGINLNQECSHAPLSERYEYFSGFFIQADQHGAGKTDSRIAEDHDIRRDLYIFPAMMFYITINLFGSPVPDDEPIPQVVDATEHHVNFLRIVLPEPGTVCT
jgi:hypothetical protein